MSSNGRRPGRPGMMSGGGAGQGAWVPGVNMPPLGYGLVAQQPHMAPPQPHMAPHQPLMAPPQQAWQQQQQQQQQHFLAQQAGLAGTMGVATLTQQQQQQQQQKYPPQHIQQQWMEAQRKAAEEQRKLYEQMMKQRQFDEQKMRLKAFNASKKSGVSADTMIENILGGKESTKQRSPQPPKKNGGVEEQGGQGNHHQATAAPTSQLQTHRQGTAVDWTKLENVNTLFASPKKMPRATATTTAAEAEHPSNPMQPPHETSTTNPTGPHNPTLRPPAAAPLSMRDGTGKVGNGRKEGKSPIVLPQWMKDTATLPEVYKRAVGLVGSAEGWVDTSRAYMLLMKTGLPPPFLGVLWEMVNCTTPGRLTQMEFSVLLALVAVVQAGQPITGPEVLNDIREPVMPLIDHPALAPLVQDYLQARQQQQQQQGMVVEAGAGSSGANGGGGGVEGTTQAQTNTITATNSSNCDDDEFDDFVGATVPSNGPIPPPQPETSSLPSSSFPTPSIPPPQPQPSSVPTSSFPNPTFPTHPPGSLIGQPQTAPILPGPNLWPQAAAPRPLAPPQTQTGDKNKAMNLPKLGFSPEPSPTTSFDDDFDDFQSAALPCVSQADTITGGQQQGGQGLTTTTPATTTPATTATSTPAMPTEQPLSPPVLQPEKPAGTAGEDKYAVFREIAEAAEPTTEVTENADDSFGEFCSSEVASLSLAQNASSSASTSSALPGLLQCQSASGTSNTSPISFEVYSTPPEVLPDTQADAFEADFSTAFASTSTSTSTKQPDNYADIHEAMKRAEAEQKRKEESKWSDPFGEFEEAPPPLPGTTATFAPVTAAVGGVSGGNGTTASQPSASGLSVPWSNVGGGTEEAEDEDFGDFMGHSGIGGGSSIHTLPPPLENLGETQSVASLELPGLEMTVGVEASEAQGGTELFLQPRGDIGTVEDQMGALNLDTATTPGGTVSSAVTTSTTQQQQQQTSTTAGHVMDSYCSSGGLVDKYSIIREEASRDTQHHGEAHTGSWERCLEGIIKVLQEAHSILTSLNTTTNTNSSTTSSNNGTTSSNAATTSIKSQVLSTSQMQDYLANVHEVWLVCGRIRVSSRRVTTSVRVDNLLSQAQTLWRDILAAAGADSAIAKPPLDPSATTTEEGDNQMGEGEVCGVCLTGGGSRLTYGGHSYHPPCANLWLNCVDLLLPSLTPVTLL